MLSSANRQADTTTAVEAATVRPAARVLVLAALGLALLAAFITVAPLSPVTLRYQAQALADRPPVITRRPNLAIGTIGHRDAVTTAPEHTLPALERVVGMGFDYVELDVRDTRDGVPVILHDKTLDRTTNGTGPVQRLDWTEIQQLDAGSWFSGEFAGERVLSLETALHYLQGRACVMWDTKAYPTARMVSLFRQYGFGRDCLLVTFGGLGSGGDERVVQRLLQLWPDAPIMPLVRQPADIATVLENYPQARGVYAMRSHVDAELVDTAHAQGLLVISGTLNQHDREGPHRDLVNAGADYFMLADKPGFERLRRSLAATPAP